MPQHRPARRPPQQYLFLLCAAAVLGFASSPPTMATSAEIPPIVATIEKQTISAEELTDALRGELLRLEMERYQVLKQKLDELIAKRLFELEATKRGVSPQQLAEREITAKMTPISPEQVKAFYEANQSRIRQPFEQIAPRIEAYLQQQEQQKQQRTFLNVLRQRYQVTVALTAPKIDVDADDDPFKGPQQATVTIIEFSDFECPYCRRVQPTLTRLMHEYDGMIKLVYRDFPLRNIHTQAQKAAEAAQCAAEQQRFWAYHDKLFATSNLEIQDLKQYAQELGLDTKRFNTCLDSGQYASEVENDLQAGMNAGVNATPAFFVNGQLLNGAVSYDRFKEVVDNALEEAQSAKQRKP